MIATAEHPDTQEAIIWQGSKAHSLSLCACTCGSTDGGAAAVAALRRRQGVSLRLEQVGQLDEDGSDAGGPAFLGREHQLLRRTDRDEEAGWLSEACRPGHTCCPCALCTLLCMTYLGPLSICASLVQTNDPPKLT